MHSSIKATTHLPVGLSGYPPVQVRRSISPLSPNGTLSPVRRSISPLASTSPSGIGGNRPWTLRPPIKEVIVVSRTSTSPIAKRTVHLPPEMQNMPEVTSQLDQRFVQFQKTLDSRLNTIQSRISSLRFNNPTPTASSIHNPPVPPNLRMSNQTFTNSPTKKTVDEAVDTQKKEQV